MRRFLRSHIPSMFHRRLLLLMAAAGAVTLLLGTATARLTLGPEQHRRQAEAEKVLRSSELIPTVRGRILDRHGRVLAEDEPAFDVAVDYAVVSGQWIHDRARSTAKATNRERWSELTGPQRDALIAEHERVYHEQVETLWRVFAEVGRVDRQHIEDRRNAIIHRVQGIATDVTARNQRRMTEQLNEAVSWAEAFMPVREQHEHHVILYNVGDDARRQIQGFIAAPAQEQRDYELARQKTPNAPDTRALRVWRHVTLERPERRRHPFETITIELDRASLPTPLRHDEPVEMTVEGVGLHVIGLMRPAWQEDLDRRPFHAEHDPGGYRDGDRVGFVGIETMMEDRLRGTRGRRIRRLDTGDIDELPAQRGADVQLTLDIQLQARVQAILCPEVGLMRRQGWQIKEETPAEALGQPFNGAAVVMEVATGDVLAAVSMPTVPLRVLLDDRASLVNNQYDAPFRNRVIAQPYQPGSTVKPLVLAAVFTDDKLGLDELVDTPGYLWPNKPTAYRDWVYKQKGLEFGEIDGTFAIMRSSNVFFGLMAQRLGAQRLTWWFERYGLGESTGCGLPGEQRGDLPDSANPRIGWGWEFMAIGQGPIRWTPLQAANAYATLARGGRFMRPRFVRDAEPSVERDLQLNQPGLERVLRGMHQSANETLGTTHHLAMLDNEPIFNVAGVTVRAKSGTAQAVPLREAIDDDGDGLPDRYGRVLRDGDHAWVIVMVQPDSAPRPTHVIAAVVEYAGSGGQVAGPVVNQIIHALKQEGYLE